MSCGCGQPSRLLHTSNASPTRESTPTRTSTVLRNAPNSDAPHDPTLEYSGASVLVITGPVTGRTYRFEGSGARVSVSRHDAASLLLYARSLRLAGPRQRSSASSR